MRQKPIDEHSGLYTPVVDTRYGEMSPTDIDRALKALAGKLLDGTLTAEDQIKFDELTRTRRETIFPSRQLRFRR